MPRRRWIPRKAAAIGRDDVKNLEVNTRAHDGAAVQRKENAKDLPANEKNEKHEETKGQGAHAKLHIRML